MSADRRTPSGSDRESGTSVRVTAGRGSGQSGTAEPGIADRRARRSVWTVLRRLLWTSTVASACTTTRVQTAPVPEPLPSGQRGEIRLALRSGQVVSIYDARVVQDSIVGVDRPRTSDNPQRVAVARADVQSIATKKLSVGKTILAAIGGLFATFTFLLLVACASLAA